MCRHRRTAQSREKNNDWGKWHSRNNRNLGIDDAADCYLVLTPGSALSGANTELLQYECDWFPALHTDTEREGWGGGVGGRGGRWLMALNVVHWFKVIFSRCTKIHIFMDVSRSGRVEEGVKRRCSLEPLRRESQQGRKSKAATVCDKATSQASDGTDDWSVVSEVRRGDEGESGTPPPSPSYHHHHH